VPTLSAINRFPVKSCRGQRLDTATVEPWGLAGDRRWLVVDEAGALLTAREHPRLLLVGTEVRADGGLQLSSPDAGALAVDVPSDGPLVPVRVWSSELLAASAAADAHAWFSRIVGEPARLVYLDDPTRRRANPRFAGPEAFVSFADGYPLLLATSGSLDQLNEWIAAGPRAEEGPLPMIRFRPNVVVDGTGAFAEDGWRRLRIGSTVFRAVKGCDRCVMTMTDAETAVRGREPIATLARHRRWDGATWFGMNLVPETSGETITVGDEVEILDAVDAPDGPPR
jgi:uncharacterized protein YcbX